jgi:hypothetical protein
MTRSVRLAVVLWIMFGGVVWNVVFDRVLVLAGRRYAYAAAVSLQRDGVYLAIDDWMRPAIQRGVLLATVAGLSTAGVGLIAIAFVARRSARHSPQAPPSRSGI